MRQRTRFKADPRNREAKSLEVCDEYFRLTGDLGLFHDLSASADFSHY